MFRIRDGKIKVFSKYVQMIPGAHTLSVDTETGSVSHGEGSPVVEYTFDEETGNVSINSLLSSVGGAMKAPTKARSWMNGRKLSSGPLYEGSEINVYLEGFAFDFNYTGVAHAVLATKPFRWTGGRVCFDDMFGGGGSNQGKYTAIPASGSCGQALIDTYDSGVGTIADIAGIYGGGTSGLQTASQRNAMEYYGNAVSIVMSYRSFRKYVSWARGLSGIFESSLGPIGASGGSVEPDGSFPSVFDAGFKFSMFNLKQ